MAGGSATLSRHYVQIGHNRNFGGAYRLLIIEATSTKGDPINAVVLMFEPFTELFAQYRDGQFFSRCMNEDFDAIYSVLCSEKDLMCVWGVDDQNKKNYAFRFVPASEQELAAATKTDRFPDLEMIPGLGGQDSD